MLDIAALVDRQASFAPRPTQPPALREIDTVPQLSSLKIGDLSLAAGLEREVTVSFRCHEAASGP